MHENDFHCEIWNFRHTTIAEIVILSEIVRVVVCSSHVLSSMTN